MDKTKIVIALFICAMIVLTQLDHELIIPAIVLVIIGAAAFASVNHDGYFK